MYSLFLLIQLFSWFTVALYCRLDGEARVGVLVGCARTGRGLAYTSARANRAWNAAAFAVMRLPILILASLAGEARGVMSNRVRTYFNRSFGEVKRRRGNFQTFNR